MNTAADNLRLMADKIYILEDLYKRIQGCFVIWSQQRQKLSDNYLTSATITSYQFNDPLLYNMKYTRFVYLIGMFLKFLSGQQLFHDDDITPDILLFKAFTPVSTYKLRFDEIVDPYINLLTNIVDHNKCHSTLAYQDFNIGAATNLYHIANRIEAMEMFYNQAQKSCIGLEEYIQGFGMIHTKKTFVNNSYIYSEPRPLSFHETMKIIGTYLKFLTGQRFSDTEYFYIEDYASAGDNFLFGLVPLFKIGINILPFDTVIEPYITWLSDISKQCRNINLLLTSNKKLLEYLYSFENILN
jgi:hypothetical protein